MVGLARRPQLDPAVDQPALDLLEPPGAEESLQHGVPLRELARRNAWNLPWGSIATWVNWVQVMPSSPVTSWPASSSRLVSGDPLPAALLLDDDVGLHPGGAVPRRLGRSHAGERVNRNVRAPTLTRSTTRGSARVGLVAAQVPRAVPVAGDLAVEREADRVQHAGLAGTRCRR